MLCRKYLVKSAWLHHMLFIPFFNSGLCRSNMVNERQTSCVHLDVPVEPRTVNKEMFLLSEQSRLRRRDHLRLFRKRRGRCLGKRDEGRQGVKGLHNCWWSQPSARVPLAAFRLDLCVSSVYRSRSQHLWTKTHTVTNAHKQISLPGKCRQVCRLRQQDFNTARPCTQLHTYYTYTHARLPPWKQI